MIAEIVKELDTKKKRPAKSAKKQADQPETSSMQKRRDVPSFLALKSNKLLQNSPTPSKSPIRPNVLQYDK